MSFQAKDSTAVKVNNKGKFILIRKIKMKRRLKISELKFKQALRKLFSA
jgi:hypothetical protein